MMNLPIVSRLLDERFFNHRRRSTSMAGVTVGVMANLLFAYRYFVDHVLSRDLLAVVLTFVVVKMALMTWYYLKD